MFLATDSFVAFDLLLFTNLDVALVAGSAASVINIIDAQIENKMPDLNLTAADCSGSSECQIGHLIFGSHWNRWHVDYCIIGRSADCVAEPGSWIGYGIVYSVS